MIRNLTLVFCLLSLSLSSFCQNTVGLITYDIDQVSEGYNLCFPHGQGNTYLLNNCGEVVNVWKDLNYKPGNSVELTEDGNIFILKGNGVASNPDIHAGGGGEKVELRDWDNNLLWEFTYNNETNRLHHDLEVLPNGNVLLVAWELRDSTAVIDAGRNPNLLAANELWPDQIIEVQVGGDNSGDIVWQWNAFDHLIQDFDATKANFGVVADHPERININYETSNGGADWLHINSVDYNPILDHILLSVPTFSEVWIIDHSTTTTEAAGSTGGASGKGGDLLYRWGNPMTYNNGTAEDQKLFFQHDPHWIDLGLNSSHLDFGKIALFNNRVGPDSSTVNIFNPPFISNEEGYLMDGDVFAPTDFDWTYTNDNQELLFSGGLSSVQRLPNNNTLILSGRKGYAFEITPTEEIVWEYINPILSSTGIAASQGDPSPINLNIMFAMKRYAPDFLGFDGKDLETVIGHIELNPDTGYCSFLLDTEDVNDFADIEIYPNPASNYIRIDLGNQVTKVQQLEVFDVLGNIVYQTQPNGNTNLEISTESWANGVYLIRMNGTNTQKVTVVK